MLWFFLFLVALAKDETYDRYMVSSSDILTSVPPSPLSILDVEHSSMLAFGPYSSSDVAAFDVASKQFFLTNWSVNTSGCIPNQPFPGACLILSGPVPIAALIPYKSSTLFSIADSDHSYRDNNGKWVVNIFGNILVMFSNTSLSTPFGPQTSKPNDAILYLEQNWIKVGNFPYPGNKREVIKSRSDYYTTFPVNSQGLTDQLSLFTVIDENGCVGYGTLSGTTHYVNGNSGVIIQHNRLVQTWSVSGN